MRKLRPIVRRHRLLPILLGVAAALRSGTIEAGETRLNGHVFTLPEGFEIECVAGTPRVDRPIGACFDEAGRLYVTDSSGSNEPVQKQLETRPHRVVRLEDRDGDGRFDESVVFAERMMFPEGVLWHEGALYVGAPPSIWRLRDTDDDGVADERIEWFRGEVLTGCANDIHGPYLGPDGWLYWTKGGFGKQNLQVPGKPAITDSAAHIYRARADGTGLESYIAGGMDNPVEVVFTPEGEVIFTTTFYSHPESGKRDGLVHAVYGGVYPKVHGVIDGLKRTGELLPILTHLGPSASCGLWRYESTGWGAEYEGNLFSTLFNMRKVMRHIPRRAGATFALRDSDFLVSDNPDFHPTDVLEDADGSLLVVDTGGWYKICCPTSQLAKPEVLGAIYRIRRQGTVRTPDPRGRSLGWEQMPPVEVARHLGDERPAVRQRAVAEMSRRGDASVERLGTVVRRGEPLAAGQAVWALARIASPAARAALVGGLESEDSSARQAVACALGLLRERVARAGLEREVRNGPAPLRREAATALGRLGMAESVRALLEASAETGDRVLEHSLIYALIEIGARVETREGLAAGNSMTRRAALIALDQMKDGGLTAGEVAPLLESTDTTLRETAAWIVSHRTDWGADLAGAFRDRLRRLGSGEFERLELKGQLAHLARDGTIQEMMLEVLLEPATEQPTRELLLAAMADSKLASLPRAWGVGLSRFIPRAEGEDLGLAIAVVQALPAAKTNAIDLNPVMLQAAADPAREPAVRLRALAATRGEVELNEAAFGFLCGQLGPEEPAMSKVTAAEVIGRARLSSEQSLEVTKLIRSAGALELPKLLAAFEKGGDADVGGALVKALEQSAALGSLRAEQLRLVVEKYPTPVQEAGQTLIARLDVNAAREKERLDELDASLPKGDRDRGRRVFESSNTACTTCHQVGYIGGRIGPDLTKIGAIRTTRDLLESILFPSASFVRSYEPMILTTRDGEEHAGVLREESGETVTVMTGPNNVVRLARSDVAEMRPGAVSVMPQGMEETLGAQELADLVDFLRSLK